MSGALVLYSGGADSYLMMLWALLVRKRVGALLIDYGQTHLEELNYAKTQLDSMPALSKKAIYRVNLSEAFRYVQSSLLSGSQAKEYPGVDPHHVPGRNLILVSVALAIAESEDFTEVWIGCDFSDRLNVFPDCAQEWVYAVDRVASMNGSRPIHVRAPLLGLTKEMVLALLGHLGVQRNQMFSGYEPPVGSIE